MSVTADQMERYFASVSAGTCVMTEAAMQRRCPRIGSRKDDQRTLDQRVGEYAQLRGLSVERVGTKFVFKKFKTKQRAPKGAN